MSTPYLGTLSLGAVIPMLADAATAIAGAAYASLPEIQAKIEVLTKLTAQLTITPPSVAAFLNAATFFQLPNVSANINAAQLAAFNVQLTGLIAFVQLQIQIETLLASAGVHLWQHTGTMNELKSNLPNALPNAPASAIANGLVLMTELNATWSAMQLIFKAS